MIKPSRRELRRLTGDGQSLGRFDHQRAVREAVEQEARAVVVSLGPGGAFLATADGFEVHVPSPDVDVVGCVGGGDSVVAGNALGPLRGRPLSVAVRLGAAACITHGSELCQLQDVDRHHRRIALMPTPVPNRKRAREP